MGSLLLHSQQVASAAVVCGSLAALEDIHVDQTVHCRGLPNLCWEENKLSTDEGMATWD